MLIYRFKVTSQEHEEYSMEIEIQPGQTFRDFHECIIETSGLLPPEKAFFFPTDKLNKKSTEISLKSYKRQEKKFDPELDEFVTVTSTPRLMKDCKIKNYIEDPHQRMIYEYVGKFSYVFMIELFKIVQSNGMTLYPACVKKTGELPKKTVPVPIPDPPKPEAPPRTVPKVILPPLEALAKLDDIVEDEEEMTKIEEGLTDFLNEEAPLEVDHEPSVHTPENDDDEEGRPFSQDEETGDDEPMEHLGDYDDIEKIEMRYSRYDTDPDDH